MTSTPINTLDAARAYVAAGLSIIPIKPNGSKRPASNLLPVISEDIEGCPRRGWGPFTVDLPTSDYLRRWFGGWGNLCGMAVLGGRVSGNLEAIDIDQPDLIEPWLEQVRQLGSDLVDRLVLVQTPRPGMHCYYRCETIGRNTKLAHRTVSDGPSHEFGSCLAGAIETRGERGYALVPPSPAICHPTRRPYVYISEKTLLDVQQITPEERELLWSISRGFDESPNRCRPAGDSPHPRTSHQQLDRRKPGDDFCCRVSWDDLLEEYGWSLWNVCDAGVQYWTRPGKSDGVSASVGYAGSDLLFLWSSSIPELDSETPYNKFSFIAYMKYDGDFSRAAKALSDQGYGQKRRRLLSAGPRNIRGPRPSSMQQDLRRNLR